MSYLLRMIALLQDEDVEIFYCNVNLADIRPNCCRIRPNFKDVIVIVMLMLIRIRGRIIMFMKLKRTAFSSDVYLLCRIAVQWEFQPESTPRITEIQEDYVFDYRNENQETSFRSTRSRGS